MSETVSQIQASYNPTEDRILLNIKSLNDHVYLAWITRRFLKLLIPALHGRHPTTGDALFDSKTSQIQQAEKEQNQLLGDFESEFKSPEEPLYPLGEQPILLAKMTFKDIYSDKGFLILEPEEGQGIVLPYHPSLLGPLIKIVSEALKPSDWNLDLDPIMEMPEKSLLQ